MIALTSGEPEVSTALKIATLLSIPTWLLILRLAANGGRLRGFEPSLARGGGKSVLLLALGDTAAFVAFGLIGLVSHEKSFAVEPVVRSIVPFAVAWLAIAPWFGAFSAQAVAGQGWGPSPREGSGDGPDPRGLARVAAIWLFVGVIALCARALVFDRELFNAFFVIALVGHGLFLVSWRAAYSRWLAPVPATA